MPALVEKDNRYIAFNSGGVAGRRRIVEEGDPDWVPTFDAIPTISFKYIDGTLEEKQALAKEVGTACRDVGFFYVMDSGLPPSLIADTFQMMERFFARSDDVKLAAHWHKSPACRGYEPFSETKLGLDAKGNLRESFAIGDDFLDDEQAYSGKIPPGTKPQNCWPPDHPELREGMYAYYRQVEPFARALLKIFALALDLPEDAFEEQYGEDAIWGMRALHYPPQEPDEDNPGLGAHTDFSSFTLVCQEPGSKPGLEVLNLNGQWVSAPPLPGCDFVVNTGDFLSQTTNNVFKSTVHRVYNRTGERRYSLPFFFSPSPGATVAPLPQFLRDDASDSGVSVSSERENVKPVNVGEHYVRRVLHSRKHHPSSVKVRKAGIPMEEWKYEMMQGVGIPE
ncbi:hypothetical protein JCM10449v2_007182 [Rhodotorula kratochvilovae]